MSRPVIPPRTTPGAAGGRLASAHAFVPGVAGPPGAAPAGSGRGVPERAASGRTAWAATAERTTNGAPGRAAKAGGE